jgi:hypothetical protein
MRKRLITRATESARNRGESWLDVERAAVVEVTSEDADYPIELALISEDSRGWRAAAAGSQTIRLVFDQPQKVSCISLVFEEKETARTQEFVLRWSPDVGKAVEEIVRQQWNFSPPESIREVEEYRVQLSSVAILELLINPNISGGSGLASLEKLRLS